MNKENIDEFADELREEYDFAQMAGGIRGKYIQQCHESAKLIMLEPDVAKIFPNAKLVNDALRALAIVIHQHQKVA